MPASIRTVAATALQATAFAALAWLALAAPAMLDYDRPATQFAHVTKH